MLKDIDELQKDLRKGQAAHGQGGSEAAVSGHGLGHVRKKDR